MKKIIALVLLTATLSVHAFWNNNNWNNMPWGGSNYYGHQNDNGIFGYNPYDFWDPRWYSEEMSNMVDEFDDNNGWGNNNYGYNPYNYRGNRAYNAAPNRYNSRPNRYINTPWGAGAVPKYNP